MENGDSSPTSSSGAPTIVPLGGSSDDDCSSNNNSRRRRRLQKEEGSNGVETDESQSDGYDDEKSEKYKIKQKRRYSNPRNSRNNNNGNGGNDNMFMIILMIGLVFCLLDVAYMVGFVERSELFSPMQQQALQRIRKGIEKPLQRIRTEIDKHRRGGIGGKKKKGGRKPAIFETTDTLQLEPYLGSLAHTGDDDDKRNILQLILEAGVSEIDYETYMALPTWRDVTTLYGDKPRIHGLKQCQAFRSMGDPADHFIGTAGCFNTGTNLLSEMLIHNCKMTERQKRYGMVNRGVRWQVPWGKHTPPGDEEFRLSHKTLKDAEVDANAILPALTIRDPYRWMQSMCKHKYTAEWVVSDHCPKFEVEEHDYNSHPFLKQKHKETFPVNVKYSDFIRKHKSLVHFYNDWYNEYRYNTTFSYIVVRFEDLLFFPKEVTKIACECAGGTMENTFTYQLDTAKKGKGAHGKNRTGYIDALIRYSTTEHRYDNFKEKDLQYLNKHVDKDVMNIFHYPYYGFDGDTDHDYGADADDEEDGSGDGNGGGDERLLDRDFEGQHKKDGGGGEEK